MDDAVELHKLSRSSSEAESFTSDDEEHDLFDPATATTTRRRSSSSSGRSYELYTPDEETAVVRKLDTRLVLFMCFLYLLSFLDRSNVGNAKLQGIMEDLNLHDDQFDWLLTAFYITYISFEWMILLYHILTPHVYISLCVLSWGLVASFQSLARSFSAMLILRALLGIGEAAFSPGMQVSAAPLAASFAGSLAYGIGKLGERSPIAPWRLLFLVEGFPSIIVAVIAYGFIPDSPGTARFLTPRQRDVARIRLRKDSVSGRTNPIEEKSKVRHTGKKGLEWSEVWETIKDPKCYLLALMFSSCNVAFSSMPVFLPSVINELGYSSINSQALSAPPFLVAFLVIVITARTSDKMKTRSPFICFHALLGFLGYGLIALGGLLDWPHFLRYLCVYPAAAGFFSAITVIIAWTINNQETNARKGTGMTILNIIGQCGPLIGTRLFPDTDKPNYVRGMTACAGAMLFVFCLALTLRIILVFENRRRARDYLRHPSDEDDEPSEQSRFVLML